MRKGSALTVLVLVTGLAFPAVAQITGLPVTTPFVGPLGSGLPEAGWGQAAPAATPQATPGADAASSFMGLSPLAAGFVSGAWTGLGQTPTTAANPWAGTAPQVGESGLVGSGWYSAYQGAGQVGAATGWPMTSQGIVPGGSAPSGYWGGMAASPYAAGVQMPSWGTTAGTVSAVNPWDGSVITTAPAQGSAWITGTQPGWFPASGDQGGLSAGASAWTGSWAMPAPIEGLSQNPAVPTGNPWLPASPATTTAAGPWTGMTSGVAPSAQPLVGTEQPGAAWGPLQVAPTWGTVPTPTALPGFEGLQQPTGTTVTAPLGNPWVPAMGTVLPGAGVTGTGSMLPQTGTALQGTPTTGLPTWTPTVGGVEISPTFGLPAVTPGATPEAPATPGSVR
ncbi:hypothetical protein LLH03_08675 [bacterium]|nr:hypothetical protein [bacterium]